MKNLRTITLGIALGALLLIGVSGSGLALVGDDIQPLDEGDTAVICFAFMDEELLPAVPTRLIYVVRDGGSAVALGAQVVTAPPPTPGADCPGGPDGHCWNAGGTGYCFDFNRNNAAASLSRPNRLTRVVDLRFEYGEGRVKTRSVQYVVAVHQFPPVRPPTATATATPTRTPTNTSTATSTPTQTPTPT